MSPRPYTPDSEPRTLRVADLAGSDKPREKALNQGIEHLSDSELMAIIFGSGMPGKSVIDLAREVLRDNDDRLSNVARMSIHALCSKFEGIGPAKAVSLAAAFELGKRCQADMLRHEGGIDSSRAIYDMMRGYVELLNYEQFWVIHLNRANKVIYRDCISRGGTAATVVDIKLVMKTAIDKLSSSLIFVHNHPSGTLSPSREDDNLTKRLKDAAAMLDIRVLDHLIISSQGYYSYADESRL